MKRCELCSFGAKIYCESDEANLCWSCDEMVHSANFLVAKHSRSLLCHDCQSSTPWIASGPKVGRTISVCQSCVDNCNAKSEVGGEIEEESQGGNEYDTEEDGENGDSDYEEEEEDLENQVVPWFSNPSPPLLASSSSSEAVDSSRFHGGVAGGVSVFKRLRENTDLDLEFNSPILMRDDIGFSSSRFHHNTASTEILSNPDSEDDEAASLTSFRSLKVQRTNETIRSRGILDRGEAELRTVAIVSSLTRYQQSNEQQDLQIE